MSFVTSKVVALLQGALKSRGLEVRRLAKQQAEPQATIDVLALCVADLQARLQARNSDANSDANGAGNEIFFVQIGAHDGLTYDPIRPFIDRFHWRGLLVEPQPRVFAQLVENYKSEPQLLFENAAIAPQDGSATLYTFAASPNLPEHASMLASFRRELLEANGHGYSGPIHSQQVPALQLSTLLKKHSIERVDILQIDTEGYDFEIIKMLDFNAIQPTLIHFENNFLSQDEFQACSKLLAGHNYRLLTLGIDTIAYQQDHSGLDNRAKMSALDA